MLSQIAHLLIQTAFGLLVYTLLLRFYMQVLRAPFRNPMGQLVTALTNWIVLPARRVIPGLMGFDLATFLLAWLVERKAQHIEAARDVRHGRGRKRGHGSHER